MTGGPLPCHRAFPLGLGEGVNGATSLQSSHLKCSQGNWAHSRRNVTGLRPPEDKLSFTDVARGLEVTQLTGNRAGVEIQVTLTHRKVVIPFHHTRPSGLGPLLQRA